MIAPAYRSQVDLLLRVLPHVADEEAFALKGGTAINLFVRDMQRLSVDIDLTYVPFDDRDTAMQNIAAALNRIGESLNKAIPDIQVTTVPQSDGQEAKLNCRLGSVQIKVEVNTTMRGHVLPLCPMPVSGKVQAEFEKFAAINVLSSGELFGGKICAALDRQHPRDLFDIHLLLENEGIADEIRLGFIAALASHSRPMSEMLRPNFLDQRAAFEKQFAGMTSMPFTYADYEETRERLIAEIHARLTEEERDFLIGFKAGAPDWELVALPRLANMPAVKWKLQNIQKLIERNPDKHVQVLKALEDVLA